MRNNAKYLRCNCEKDKKREEERRLKRKEASSYSMDMMRQ